MRAFCFSLFAAALISNASAQLLDPLRPVWRWDYAQSIAQGWQLLPVVQAGQAAYLMDFDVRVMHEIDITNGQTRRVWGLPAWRSNIGICFGALCGYGDFAIANTNAATPWIFRAYFPSMPIFSGTATHQLWIEPTLPSGNPFNVFVRAPNKSFWLDYQTGQQTGSFELLDYVGNGLALGRSDASQELLKISSVGQVQWRLSLATEIDKFAFNATELASVLGNQLVWRDLQTGAALTSPITLDIDAAQIMRFSVAANGDVMLMDDANRLLWFSRMRQKLQWQRSELPAASCRVVNRQVWCFGPEQVIRFDQQDGMALGSFSIESSPRAFPSPLYKANEAFTNSSAAVSASHLLVMRKPVGAPWQIVSLDTTTGAVAWQKELQRNRLSKSLFATSQSGVWLVRDSNEQANATIEKISHEAKLLSSFKPNASVSALRSITGSPDVLLDLLSTASGTAQGQLYRFRPDGTRMWQAPSGTQIAPEIFAQYLINDAGLVRLDTGALIPLPHRVVGSDHRYIYTQPSPETFQALDPQTLAVVLTLPSSGIPVTGQGSDALLFYSASARRLSRYDGQTGVLLNESTRPDWSSIYRVSRHGNFTLVNVDGSNGSSHLLLDANFQLVKELPDHCKPLAEQPKPATTLSLLCNQPHELQQIDLSQGFRTARYMLNLAVNPISSPASVLDATLFNNRLTVVESSADFVLQSAALRLSQYAIEPNRMLPKMSLQFLSQQGSATAPLGAKAVLQLRNLSATALTAVRLQLNVDNDEVRIQTTGCTAQPPSAGGTRACQEAIQSLDRLKFLDLPPNGVLTLELTVRADSAQIATGELSAYVYLPLPFADDASGTTFAKVALQNAIFIADGFEEKP